MLTIFAVPKPFEGHAATVQRNAIRSWKLLDPACQVIICGNETGSAEAASEFELDHIPAVQLNDLGTPLLGSVFRRAEELAIGHQLCYLNADLEKRTSVAPYITRLTREKHLGMKTGKGIFEYTPERTRELRAERGAKLLAVRKAMQS